MSATNFVEELAAADPKIEAKEEWKMADTAVVNSDKISVLPMSEVFADEEFNCRGKIAPIDVVDLANNIREQGLIQPILVQPWDKRPGKKWRIVAGYRRYIAHQVNKAETINAIIREGLNEDDAQFLNLSENLNRQDLNLMQEALVVKKLIEKGHTQDEIKTRLNMSRMWVQVRQYALDLPEEIQNEIKAGWIKQSEIVALNHLKKKPEEQLNIAREIKEKRQRGEKLKVKVSGKTLKKDANAKMARDRGSIQNMMDHIIDSVGASFATRCLAWASGEISSNELYQDIKEEAADKGVMYFPPNHDVASSF